MSVNTNMNSANNMSSNNENGLKVIGLIFGCLFGCLFGILLVVLSVFCVFDTMIYSTAYTQCNGVVVDASEVESYLTTVTTRHKSTTGKRRYRTETKTVEKYRQDIVVSYHDNKTVDFDDVSVSKDGYAVNDVISLYISNDNPDDVVIHADISNKNFLYGICIFTGIYWVVYVFCCKSFIKRKSNHIFSS